LLYFHNNCYMNVPQCYIIHILPVLLLANLVEVDFAQPHHFAQFMLLILLRIFLAYNCT